MTKLGEHNEILIFYHNAIWVIVIRLNSCANLESDSQIKPASKNHEVVTLTIISIPEVTEINAWTINDPKVMFIIFDPVRLTYY